MGDDQGYGMLKAVLIDLYLQIVDLMSLERIQKKRMSLCMGVNNCVQGVVMVVAETKEATKPMMIMIKLTV